MRPPVAEPYLKRWKSRVPALVPSHWGVGLGFRVWGSGDVRVSTPDFGGGTGVYKLMLSELPDATSLRPGAVVECGVSKP